jgi:glycosidase
LVLDHFIRNTQIITETNVPHKENIGYFGNGQNEAHMVYQFSLPPLVLHTFTTHNARTLTEWAKTIDKVSDKATYFNFLASHDGIGMRPTDSVIGVPAIYYHSLLGSRNDYNGYSESGINRRINREKLEYSRIIEELEKDSRRSGIFEGLKKLISIRQGQSVFSPYVPQEVLDLGEKVFALRRVNQENGEILYFVVNVDNKETFVDLNISGTDLVSGNRIEGGVRLAPYQFIWVK